ncbi:hypothetical protein [Bacillus massiliglaciei]|uniref:hypothetical protein n=1 Tax=Bacillus massiliglaciei TaxID=1816693 RepID=UPI0018FE37FF|nr:hypothetical protein [Bacillus massiliglaciei]
MLVAGRIENFKEYSKFSSIKEFNNTIEMFLAEHKKDFRCSQCQDWNTPKSHQ